MGPSLEKLAANRKLMALTAAAMYGGAAIDGVIEGLIPGDPSFAIQPVLVAGALAVALVAFGARLPRAVLAGLGPVGVLLIAYALAETPGAGDGAILYVWPVLWTTFFFGRRGAVAIVACVGAAHAGTLLLLPEASSYAGRWVDVMVSVCVVAIVVLMLVHRNDELLTRLAEEARGDALTGLLNRRGFEERAELELARARRDGSSIAIVAFDLDYFKRINDEWGHDTGDRVLAYVGGVLVEHSRDLDIVARFGGEEFVVLLPDSASGDAAAFAERVRRALAASHPDGLPTVRVSAGVHAGRAPASVETVLHGADTALYNAKRAGRDRTIVFESRPAAASLAPAGAAHYRPDPGPAPAREQVAAGASPSTETPRRALARRLSRPLGESD